MFDDSTTKLKFENCLLDVQKRVLIRGDEQIQLPPKAFEVLVLLAKNRGKSFSAEDIKQQIWPGQSITSNNVWTHIRTIRIALGDSDEKYILTENKQYRFLPVVTAALTSAATVPIVPLLFVGREEHVQQVKKLLAVAPRTVGIYGTPGVGKTTLLASLYHNQDIRKDFRDGVLWVSLGQEPNTPVLLKSWHRMLGINGVFDADNSSHIDQVEAHRVLLNHLLDKRALIMIDDVWNKEDLDPFLVGGIDCSTLITTREPDVLSKLGLAERQRYQLPLLDEEPAVHLVRELAQAVVEKFEKETRELVRTLEFLPLALQVAARMLADDYQSGFNDAKMKSTFIELCKGKIILEESAPGGTGSYYMMTPTVRFLLKKSTDRLGPQTQDRFRALGEFAEKPADFGLDGVSFVWKIDHDESMKTLDILLRRGLIEPSGAQRYRIHALLHAHAQTM
jgi:hypothetical protein